MSTGREASQLIVCLLSVAVTAGVGLTGCGSLFGNRPNDTYEARKRLARELIGREEWGPAFFYADQLHRERPREPEALVLRGIVYRERGLPAEAEADLAQALQLEDRNPEAHAALGVLYDATRRGELAERHHRRAVELAPEQPVFLNNLGFSLFLRQRHRDSIEVLQRAARLSPTSQRIRTNLGFAYAAAGDFPRAAREFEMAATPYEAKNNLGFAYEKKGDLPRAFDMYLEAVRLNPKGSRARANLHYVAKKLGKELPPDVPLEQKPEPRSEKQ